MTRAQRRSAEAFQASFPWSGGVKGRIVKAIEATAFRPSGMDLRLPPGLTCDQVEVLLGLKHQTASAEIRHLVQDGCLADSGRKRPTRSGCRATIWVVP